MSTHTIITAGQSLLDVAVQELGSLESLFDLADAAGLAITDALTPGAMLPVPASAAALPDVARYFAGRGQRINTGDVPAGVPPPRPGDYTLDYAPGDYLTI
ncbi:hypothetical protein Q5H93_21785 [Hymenobacter sp. ASUV-10]|uniref:LysM domain-containing protein n=1 Tax=Hymenobacter aranciens TaxID=3063996 RepID=A0ABT9BI84_9BACT|nr:hypothetical protein [Hymenobacter sp. ASUV-10]MDO7877388.1 hypothetical protein [Hymenobacter sp. ASUV-10]